MKRQPFDSQPMVRRTGHALCDACREQAHCPLPSVVKGAAGSSTSHVLQTRYRAGQPILNEGEPVTGLHVLCNGWATVTKNVGTAQGDRTLYVVGAGGLLDVSDNLAASKIYSGTAKSLTHTTVAFVRSDEFAARLERDHTFSGKLLRLLARQLRALEEQYVLHQSRDAASRIIHVFLAFAKPYCVERGKSVTVPMKLSRSSLAEIVGTTPETISRAISRLKQQRHILETPRETIIPDIERLRSLIQPAA